MAISYSNKVGDDEIHLYECHMQCYDAVLHSFNVEHLQPSEWQELDCSGA